MESNNFATLALKEVVPRRTVVDSVYQSLLDAVYSGDLPQGQRISDVRLAEQMGISRTPVREAIQRLRDIGIIEASPNRYTRVARVNRSDARDALEVWLALYLAVIDEVVPNAQRDTVLRMEKELIAYNASTTAAGVGSSAAQHFQEFFAVLREQTENHLLRRSLNSISYLVRLGWQTLPPAHPEKIELALERMLEAVSLRDVPAASEAVRDAVYSRLKGD